MNVCANSSERALWIRQKEAYVRGDVNPVSQTSRKVGGNDFEIHAKM